MWQIFKHFFTLGWISFGGPAAHLGYFQRHFVDRHGWLDAHHYAQLVALSQFLPGPSSSQVGFAIGYHKGRLPGAVTAFIAFTFPSFLLMALAASVLVNWQDNMLTQGVIHGLKLFAVVVVADAVVTMARQFWRKWFYVVVGLLSALTLWLWPGLYGQFGVLIGGAVIGALIPVHKEVPLVQSRRPKWWALACFLGLFFALPLVASEGQWLGLFNDFFQAGSLVFGGGHVVLPLLQQTLADQVSQETFLAGYASAQAVPGPMFTIASFLGYELGGDTPWMGAVVATIAIFLPGFLLMLTFLRSWQAFASHPQLAGAIAGVNAAVVGLLLSAWYSPILLSSVKRPEDFVAALVGFFLLRQLKVKIFVLLPAFALLGAVLTIKVAVAGG